MRLAAALVLGFAAALGGATPARAQQVVEPGATVSLAFTLTLEDGTEAQRTAAEDPMVYEHGAGELLPALEQALAGMRVEERKTVTLTPEQGYGEYDPKLVVEVDASQIPAESRQADAVVIATDPAGRRKPVRVQEARGDTVVLDFNHPLAGHALTFDVRIVAIE